MADGRKARFQGDLVQARAVQCPYVQDEPRWKSTQAVSPVCTGVSRAKCKND
jgi:hypothetical protein